MFSGMTTKREMGGPYFDARAVSLPPMRKKE